MPARLAIRAVNKPDLPKGAIVSAFPANHDLGSAVTLPNWIVVDVSGVSYKVAKARIERSRRRPQFEVLSSNKPTDTHSVRLSGVQSGTKAGFPRTIDLGGGLTLEQYLLDWNAVITDDDAVSVTFSLNVFDTATSKQFWDADVSAVVFTEIDYDQNTGVHRIQIDYSATPFNPNLAAMQVVKRNADVIDHNRVAKVITADIERVDVRQEFLRELIDFSDATVAKRRWGITEAAVDQVIANGGTATITQTQLLNNLVDFNG